MPHNWYKLGSDQSIRKVLYLKNKEHFLLYESLHSRDLFQTPQLSLTGHPTKQEKGWLQAVKNKGHFTGRTKYLLRCIMLSLRDITIKETPITYPACATKSQVWLRSVNNEGHINERTMYHLRSITSSFRGISLKLHTYPLLRIRNNWYKFDCDQSKIDILL